MDTFHLSRRYDFTDYSMVPSMVPTEKRNFSLRNEEARSKLPLIEHCCSAVTVPTVAIPSVLSSSTSSFHPPCRHRGWHHVLERGCPSAHPRECRREVRADGQRRRIYRAINAANLSLQPAFFAHAIVSFVRVSVQYLSNVSSM